MSAGYVLPTPAEVGEFYNRANEFLTRCQGGSMHYGYWTGPDDESTFEQAAVRFTDIMIGKLRVGPGDQVLDLGCGTGKPAVQLARATGAEVVGISVSDRDVELANARAAAEGMSDRVRFIRADAMDLPFPDGSFDAVLAFESIVHIPDRVHVLGQIARVLRPGGRVALTDAITRGQVTSEAEEEGLAHALAVFRAAPPVPLDGYRSFVPAAGLVLDELTDVSENTKYTYRKVFAEIYGYASSHEIPVELAPIVDLGPGMDHLDDTEVDEGNEGVVLVVAHRPGAGPAG